MKTDAIFYQLFQTLPDLFFKLAGIPYSDSYQFQAVELKQTAFRLDGLFVSKDAELPLIFVEVQFQKDERFYGRFFSEIMLYLYQQQPKQVNWQAVAIFPSRVVDVGKLDYYQTELPHLQRIYLDEVLPQNTANDLSLLSIIIANESKAIEIAKDLLQQPSFQVEENALLLNMIETILKYKLPHTPREEIWKMINLAHVDITRTSWYQEGKEQGILFGKEVGKLEGKQEGKLEGKQEGKQEGELLLLMRLLHKRFGQLNSRVTKKIAQLSSEQLEQLADDFFQFESVKDLQKWLKEKV
jgi:predicted transposase/invertase (TIGR01784 family)